MLVDSVIGNAGNNAGVRNALRKEVKPRDFQHVAPGEGKRLARRPVEQIIYTKDNPALRDGVVFSFDDDLLIFPAFIRSK